MAATPACLSLDPRADLHSELPPNWAVELLRCRPSSETPERRRLVQRSTALTDGAEDTLGGSGAIVVGRERGKYRGRIALSQANEGKD
mmetsp:Transcript_10405/g.30610  ORF Transcript_10405/g.30610 Transcript_10405/m.30610 type:complete len:88 (-) Transcript_10405:132-395(-)